MQRFTVTLFLCCSSVLLFAQNTKIDSLLKAIGLQEDDSTKVEQLIHLSILYENQNFDTAIYYAIKASNLAKQAGLRRQEASSHNLAGDLNRLKGNYYQALQYFQKSMAWYQQVNDSLKICHTLSNIGNVYWTKGDIHKGNDYYIKSFRIAERLDDKFTLYGISVNLGLIYSDMGNKEKSLEYFSYSLKGYRELQMDWGITTCLLNIGNVKYFQKKHQEAIDTLMVAIPIAQKSNNRRSLAMLYSSVGTILVDLEDYDKASKHFDMAMGTYTVMGDAKGLANVHIYKAQMFLDSKIFEFAIKNARNAFDITRENGILDTQIEACKILSEAYEEEGNFRQALYFQKQFKTLNDSIFNTEKAKNILQLQTEFETEKKDKENKLLKLDNELKDMDIKKQKGRNYLLIISVLLLLVFIVDIYRRMLLKKKINKQLVEKNKVIKEQQEELSSTLNQLEESNEELESQKNILHQQNEILEEANATKDKFFSIIAHDLKSPFNIVLGFSELLRYKYNDIDDEKRLKYIDSIFDSAQKTFKLLENLLIWARTQSDRIEINKENLVLEELLDDTLEPHLAHTKNKGIVIQTEIDKDIVLNADKYTLSTVFTNLISNALKFTNKGGKISITTKLVDKECQIYFSDNGKGISEENMQKLFKITENYSTPGTEQEQGTGLGLILCKEFVELNGGNIHVESVENKGTTFTVSLPL